MTIRTILNNQIRHCGKTFHIIESTIKFAKENPTHRVLLCLSHHSHEFELPKNVTIVKANTLTQCEEFFKLHLHTAIAIDHHIKDNTLLSQAKEIEELKDQLLRCRQKLDAIDVLLKA